MRDIVKAHGAVWIAQKAAELGYQIPSTIHREEVPVFNFWLERYVESPFERYLLALYQSKQVDPTDTLSREQKKDFKNEMKQRQWFEKHLEEFYQELDQAVDYIASASLTEKISSDASNHFPRTVISTWRIWRRQPGNWQRARNLRAILGLCDLSTLFSGVSGTE